MPLLSLSLAREIAYDAYVAVMHNREKPQDVLENLYAKEQKNLRRLDRNFIKEIVYGGLRYYSKIYWILQNTARRDLGQSPPEIQAALVLGTYQIYYMDRVPDRAAVNESVEYVRKKGQAAACSFVNGILRQIARKAAYFAKPDKQKEPVEYLSLQFAHPNWVVRRWFEHFKFEKLEVMLAANNKMPPNTVRINTLKTPTTEMHGLQTRLLKEEKTHTDKRPLRTALWFDEAPNFDDGSLFQQGYYVIQDEASQLIPHLLDVKEGETIVDACAGPGGKLSHIYELGKEAIRLIAVEKNPKQLQRAKENFARLGFEKVEWVEQDFLEWQPATKVDKILLDAPCSGLGVLRRHPEGKWQKQESIISEMVERQWRLIRHALTLLKPGGELIFSVCSFEPNESEFHVKKLVKEFPDQIEQVSPVARLPDYYKKYVTRDNILLIYAGNSDEMDGFGAFIVRLKAEFKT